MVHTKHRDSELSWSDARKLLTRMSRTELLAIVRDLYGLFPENRKLLNERLGARPEILESFRKGAESALNSDAIRKEQVDLRSGKRFIGRRRKPGKIAQDLAELMVTYVEAATRLTQDSGDTDESFRLSLEIAFSEATEQTLRLPRDSRKTLVDRLAQVVTLANRVGRGYHHAISNIYEDAFGDDR